MGPMTAGRRAEWPEFVIVRADGRYFQDYRAAGFLWEVTGRWVRSAAWATKFPSERIARQVLAECHVIVPVAVRRLRQRARANGETGRRQQPTRR